MYLETTDSLEIVLAAAVTTSAWDFVASYADDTAGTPLGTTVGTSNNTTHVTVVAAHASVTRIAKLITVTNKDTVEGTVLLKLNRSTTRYTLHEVILSPGETVSFFEGGAAPVVYDVNGMVRSTNTIGQQVVNGVYHFPGLWGGNTTKTLTSGTTFAHYMGRIQKSTSEIKVLIRVTTGAGTITWAEAGICSGQPVLNGNASLSLIGSAVDISSVINTIGLKSITFTGTFTAGQHLWFVIGNSATTAGVLRAFSADDIQSGILQEAAATRPSTMSTPTSFTLQANTATAMFGAFQPL